MDNKDSATMEMTLLAICKLIGVRVPPDVVVLSELVSFIGKYWGAVTPNQLKEAIDHALFCGIENYGAMDKSFISKAMNLWRANKPREQVPQLAQAIFTPRTSQESFESLTDYYKKYNEVPLLWDWNKVYDYMIEEGIIKDEDITDAKKQALAMQIIARHKSDIIMKSNSSVSEIVIRAAIESITPDSTLVKQETIKQLVIQKLYESINPTPVPIPKTDKGRVRKIHPKDSDDSIQVHKEPAINDGKDNAENR